MRFLRVLLLGLVITSVVEVRLASASDLTVIQQIIGLLETRNTTCEVDVTYFAKLRVPQKLANTYETAWVWIYSVVGCGGGNNWSSQGSVFGVKSDKIRELGAPLVWSVIKGADFNEDRALVYAVDVGPDDPHCCPTQGKTVEITIGDGVVNSRLLRTWRAKE